MRTGKHAFLSTLIRKYPHVFRLVGRTPLSARDAFVPRKSARGPTAVRGDRPTSAVQALNSSSYLRIGLLSLTVLIATAAQVSCGLRPDRVTFQAKVADLRKPGNSFARNKRPDDLVEIALPGRMLEVPAVVKLVGRREADWSTPESAVAAILSANVAGDVPWILQSFVPTERNEALKQFADPVAVERGRESYAAMGKFAITGQAEVQGFTV